MVDFDAERYLRVLGEQELADRDPASPWARPIDHAAAALVAVGAIAAGDARAVLAEYGCEPPAAANADDGWVAGRRVVALNTDLRLRLGTLRLGYGLLGDDETAIAASYRADPGHTGIYHDWIRVPSGWPSGLQPSLLTDDRGRATALTFHGSGNDDRWRATLRAESPIATDTAWINLCGARIACLHDGPAVRVVTEPVCEADSAHAHLWRRLARSDPEVDREPLQPPIHAELCFTRHQPGVQTSSPVRSSSHLWPPDGTGALGLEPRASHPPLMGRARRGEDRSSSTDLQHALRHRPSLQSCVLTQCVRPHVARDEPEAGKGADEAAGVSWVPVGRSLLRHRLDGR